MATKTTRAANAQRRAAKSQKRKANAKQTKAAVKCAIFQTLKQKKWDKQKAETQKSKQRTSE